MRGLVAAPLALLLAGLVAPVIGPASAEPNTTVQVDRRAKKVAQLKITEVKAPRKVAVGAKARVKVTVANVGKAKSTASTTTLFLSLAPSTSTAGLPKAGKVSTKAIKPGKKRVVTVVWKVRDNSLSDGLYVTGCADSGRKVKESNEKDNCRASKRSTAVNNPPDSVERIRRAVEDGSITQAKAHLYLALSGAGDSHLPKAYRTADTSVDSREELTRVGAVIADQSEATQAKLDPFFSPPAYAGAYQPGAPLARGDDRRAAPLGQCLPSESGEPRQLLDGWSTTDSTHFRIWSYNEIPVGNAITGPPAESTAAAARIAGIAENVYTAETALWRAPLSDAANQCNGGNGLIDIYLVRLSNNKKAQVVAYPPGAVNRPGWMWIAPDATGSLEDTRDIFAHEFAHLTQLAYDYVEKPSATFAFLNVEYGWLEEASATWAIDYVYPDDVYEQRFARKYMFYAAWNDALGECRSWGCLNGYRDYLFFFYLTHKLGSNAVMTNLWNQTESKKSIAALDAALGGDFEGEWEQFPLYNMNREDYDDYTTWDELDAALPLGEGIHQPVKVALKAGRLTKTPIPFADIGGESMSAKEYRWDSYDFPDADAREITFRGYGYRKDSDIPVPFGASVTAWYKLADGSTHTEDWTDGKERSFCRDTADQDLTELVLFYGNGTTDPYLENSGTAPSAPTPKGVVVASPVCLPKYEIQVEFVNDMPSPFLDEHYTMHGRLDTADPAGGCGEDCKPIMGTGTWTGTYTVGCDDDSPVVDTEGTVDLYGSIETYEGPPQDIDQDGRFGDELFFFGGLMEGDGPSAFLFASPGGFFPLDGGTFVNSEETDPCLFNDPSAPRATHTYTYTITRL